MIEFSAMFRPPFSHLTTCTKRPSYRHVRLKHNPVSFSASLVQIGNGVV